MHKLIVTAHPNPVSFTNRIAWEIKNLSEKRWDTVEILDLYTTELKQDFLSFEDPRKIGGDSVTKALQEKIMNADELVFVFPIWWGDAPAILKNFIDCNFHSWFAFRYENGRPIGLLKGKSARIIATSWGPSFFYKMFLHIQLLWNLNRIGFCGMKQKTFTVFGKMDQDTTDKNGYLKTLEKLV